MATKQSANKEPVPKKKSLPRRIGMVLLILLVLAAGFIFGVKLEIFGSDETKESLSTLPVIGQYFVVEKPEEESTVPDEKAQQEAEAQAKRDAERSKAVTISKEEIEKLTKQRQDEEKKRVSKLARLYNEMKPAEAARILETMDNDIVIAIFQRMDESQVSQILAEFEPGHAAAISSSMYVGVPKRVQQITNDAQGAVSYQ